MKTSILSLVSVLFLFGCSSGPSASSMLINGNVKGLKKGTLYLQHVVDSVLITVDSLQIEGDGHFSFETELEDPELFYLYLKKKDNNDINDRISFFAEAGEIQIETQWNTFDSNASISGSETHEKFEEFRDMMTKFNTENLRIIQSAIDPEIQQDSLALDSIQKASDKNIRRRYLYALNFALNNKDSHIAPYIALSEVSDANIKYLDSVYNSLSPEVANAKYGKQLQAYLEQKRNEN